MKKMILKSCSVLVLLYVVTVLQEPLLAQGTIINHQSTDITKIPESAINAAKANLHIAYGHTSHGSQLTTGMNGLIPFANGGGLGLSLATDIFKWNNGGSDGALDLHNNAMAGDCGYYPQWVNNTKDYLDDTNNSDVNVIIWSWCGQAAGYTEQNMIDKYLSPMSQLEKDYPGVTFVYMTGHLDGSGESGNLHLRNQQIRQFCIDSNRVLYDFYDIECYDPDGNYYGDKKVNDACDYDSNGDGSRDKNWAADWQNSHTKDTDWYDCGSAHSEALNANRKAYAAWWLWAALAGWDTTATRFEGNNINQDGRPDSFILLENYPNPFNPITTIHYSINKNSEMKLVIYDIQGQRIKTLFSGKQNSGEHYFRWNASGMPSGEYICQLRVNNRVKNSKIILLK